MPFLTEELHQRLPKTNDNNSESIMVATFPQPYQVKQWSAVNCSCLFLLNIQLNLIIIKIIWFGDTVTLSHLTKCNTNSKVRAMLAQLTVKCLIFGPE